MKNKSILGEIGSVSVETKNEVQLKIDTKSVAIAILIILTAAIMFIAIKKQL